MAFLSCIFFGFLGVCAFVGCARAGRIMVKAINTLFDKIEEKLG